MDERLARTSTTNTAARTRTYSRLTAALKIKDKSMFDAPNPASGGRREWEDRNRGSYGEKEKRGGVTNQVMAAGDTLSLALHLLWVHWSRVHWGRGRELRPGPGDIHCSWGIRPEL